MILGTSFFPAVCPSKIIGINKRPIGTLRKISTISIRFSSSQLYEWAEQKPIPKESTEILKLIR